MIHEPPQHFSCRPQMANLAWILHWLEHPGHLLLGEIAQTIDQYLAGVFQEFEYILGALLR